MAQPLESLEDPRDSFRAERSIRVAEMEVEMGRVGVARVSEPADELAFLHLVAQLDRQGARDQVGVEGKFPPPRSIMT